MFSSAKSYLLTGTAAFALAPLAGLAGGSAADAADLALKAPPAPVTVPNWAGWYVGLNIGGASEGSYFSDPDSSFAYTPSWHHGSAFIGGAQVGYNWQTGNFVYGLEGDISGLSKSKGTYFPNTNPGATGCCTYGSNVPWLATVRARLGMTLGDPNTLLYATGGLAVGHVKASGNELFFGEYNDYSSTRVGWAAGGGIERMIAPHWTVGLEGLFVDLGSYRASSTGASTDSGKCCATVHNNMVIGRLKLNYKF